MDDQQENYPTNQGVSSPSSQVTTPSEDQTQPQPQQAVQGQTNYPQTPQPPVQPQPPMQQVPVQPETPQYSQPQVGQPPTQGSKSLQKILIVLAVVTLLAAAGGGFYLGAGGLMNSKIGPTPAPTTSPTGESAAVVTLPTETPTPEVILQAKVFDSDKFSFSYPGYFSELTLKLDEDGVEILPRTFEASYLVVGQEGSLYTALLQVVGPEDNSEGFKIKQWLGEKGKLDLGEGLEADIASSTLGGIDASIVTGFRTGTNNPGLISAYFILDDGVYSVILNIAEGVSEIGKYEDDFEALLASLNIK